MICTQANLHMLHCHTCYLKSNTPTQPPLRKRCWGSSLRLLHQPLAASSPSSPRHSDSMQPGPGAAPCKSASMQSRSKHKIVLASLQRSSTNDGSPVYGRDTEETAQTRRAFADATLLITPYTTQDLLRKQTALQRWLTRRIRYGGGATSICICDCANSLRSWLSHGPLLSMCTTRTRSRCWPPESRGPEGCSCRAGSGGCPGSECPCSTRNGGCLPNVTAPLSYPTEASPKDSSPKRKTRRGIML